MSPQPFFNGKLRQWPHPLRALSVLLLALMLAGQPVTPAARTGAVLSRHARRRDQPFLRHLGQRL